MPLPLLLQVLLLSARNALLSRLVLAGRADPANTQRFSRIAFGSFNPRSSNGGRSTELLHAAAEDMLQGSGVPELEERVLGFLFEAAAGVKLMAVLDDAGRLLTEVGGEVRGGALVQGSGLYGLVLQGVGLSMCDSVCVYRCVRCCRCAMLLPATRLPLLPPRLASLLCV